MQHFFSKQLAEFHSLHAIQSQAFQELSLALYSVLLFHHCILAKTTADREMFAEASVLINICCNVVEKNPFATDGLSKAWKPD